MGSDFLIGYLYGLAQECMFHPGFAWPLKGSNPFFLGLQSSLHGLDAFPLVRS